MVNSISEKIVAALPAPAKGNKLHYFSGATVQGKKAPSGFAVRVTASGTKSFVWFHRVDGRSHLETLGRWDENEGGGTLTVRAAIVKAQDRAKAIERGEDREGNKVDPRPARTRRLQDGDGVDGLKIGGGWDGDESKRTPGQKAPGILDKFVERYVEREARLRSGPLIKATLKRLVAPRIGHLGIYEIRRSHIVDMLDEIADEHPVMADRVLAYVRKAFNWWAARDDEFQPPIVRGMGRTRPKERARKRILDDQEIRDVWRALDHVTEPECYPRFVKMLLLTATRRTEASMMSASEVDGDLWVIPGERYKTGLDHAIPLTPEAKGLIGEKPKGLKGNNWFIFSTTGGEKAFSGYSKAKLDLDAKIAELRAEEDREPMPPWVLHDLRRTARSLMSRAKVPSDHAERALGHVLGGVRETYDRHAYLDEKRAAFEALARLVDRILNPTANVFPLGLAEGA